MYTIHTMKVLGRKEKEKGTESIFERNNGQKFPKLDERHEYMHLRRSKTPNMEKLKEIHTNTHYNKTVKR